MDKFALVYEFNKESPLLTYMASKEIEAKNYSKAVELLAKAVEKYPYHLTARLLYVIALAHNNEFEKAKEILQNSDDLLNNPSTLIYYNNRIDKIKRENEGVSFNLDETVNEVLDDSFVEPEEYNSETEFDLLSEISDGNSSSLQNETIRDNSIITETLAEIYASQENYNEALQIFDKLKIIKPELKEKYDLRISEINIAIENKKLRKFGN